MSAHRPEHLELCAGSVLDALDHADQRELEAHRAAGCPACEAEIARLQEAVLLLAHSVQTTEPSAALRARTLAAIAAESKPATTPEAAPKIIRLPESRRSGVSPWALAAAATLLAISTVGLWRQGEQLRGELREVRQHLADSELQLLDERRWTEVLNAMDAQSVSLSPTADGAADLRGRGTFDPGTHRAVIVFEHVVAPSGRDYELWGLHPDGPRSLGLVRADASGRAIVKLEDTGDPNTLQAFAISLEPEGGSPNPNAPSGPVVMVGKVKP